MAVTRMLPSGVLVPKLYADTLPLHASCGDEFADPALPGWTLGGGLTSGDISAVNSELYDPSCLDVVLSAALDRMLRPVPATTDYEAYLTLHGVNNDAATPTTALGGMINLVFVDDSGNGTGVSCYNDGNAYMWAITAYAYAGTGNMVAATWSPLATATGWPVIYRLTKVGSTITGRISFNGGVFYNSHTRTDSTTFTKMGIIRTYTNGGTNPRLRVGRFNAIEL